jgi:hypothetical protein
MIFRGWIELEMGAGRLDLGKGRLIIIDIKEYGAEGGI